MSVRRVVRYIFGVLIAGILLGIGLPFVGVPSSHFLPPPHVWDKAEGKARGVLTGKYYDITGNPFDVGAHLYFVNYQFMARAPLAAGAMKAGKPQTYTGTVRLRDKAVYESIGTPADVKAGDAPAKQVVPVNRIPVRVRYEKTYPDISGIDEAWGGRSIGAGSNLLSGWLIWVFATLVLGWFMMVLLERFGAKENI